MTFRLACLAIGTTLLVLGITARGVVTVTMLSGVEIETSKPLMIVIGLCNAFWWLPGIAGIVLLVIGACMSEKPID